MKKEVFEQALEFKIKPLLDQAMHKILGITVSEIKSDISDKLKKAPVLDFIIDTRISFKICKKSFKKFYLSKLLRLHFGNVSEVSRIAQIERETLHRLIKELKIDVETYRKELLKADYIKEIAIKGLIEKTLEQYKEAIHPNKFKKLYENAPGISKDIVKELPDSELSLKEAEEYFEKTYLRKALEENKQNISQTARRIGLRFETLYRKLKQLGLLPNQNENN
ncbi:hypothetical protein HYV79_01790 [Candidatus Woesearchaeota archaeon]|nr:hypothetical protein [Candidatus Woesearchaeota archaeon]